MFKVISINIVVITILLLLLEVCFGGWFSSNTIEHLNILRNVQYTVKTAALYNSKQKTAFYSRDAYGLRGLHRDPSTIDILTIGGSTTDQRYLTEGETWQDKLEDLLKESGKEIEVANAGLDGLSTSGEIEVFNAWLPRIPNLKPRYVLLYNGINDIFSERMSAYNDVVGNKTIKGIIRAKSALYELYQKMRGAFVAYYSYPVSHRVIRFDRIDWTTSPIHHNHQEMLAQKVSLYDESLSQLQDKIEKMGARPIFVTQPSAMFRHQKDKIVGVVEKMTFHGQEINGVDLYYMLAAVNAKTMEFCKRVDGVCLDLAKDVDFEDGDFYDYFHNTPQGAEKIADYLFKRLKIIL